MKPTIQMIADRCNVSRGTVDRVIYHRGSVKPEIRQRVQTVIDELGYRPPKMRVNPLPGLRHNKIGFLVPQWLNGYFKDETYIGIHLAERELQGFGCEIVVEEMNSRSTDEYCKRIRKLLSTGVNGLILNASNNETIRSEIDRAVDLGIPVITYDSDVMPSGRMCHIGQDVLKSGRVAAGLMATHLTSKDKLLVITGDLTFDVHRMRVNGFCQRLQELDFSSETYDIIECYERFDLASENIHKALSANHHIRSIYMATESVPGCVDGIKRSKLPYKIHVICHDMTPSSKQFLQAGKVDFVIDQTFTMQAYKAIMTLYNYLRHGINPENDVIFTDIKIISHELL